MALASSDVLAKSVKQSSVISWISKRRKKSGALCTEVQPGMSEDIDLVNAETNHTV